MNLARVEEMVRERLGLDPAALGPAALPRAITRRMHATGQTSAETYQKVLANDPAEAIALAEELVVAETWFFRGGRALFDRLAEFLATRPAPARVLSLPCSTGEEPYSLVIALHERLVPPSSYTIDAVDMSATHLARAAAARFSAFAFREAGTDVRPAYFQPHGDRWELLPHLRAEVRFRVGNATDPKFLDNEAPYDLILCRNLFIYLTDAARRQTATTLDRLLAADGRLCLSPSEADRLPPGRFVVEPPVEFGIYRRVTPAPIATPSSSPSISPMQPWLTKSSRAVTICERPANVIPKPPVGLETARTLADAGRLTEARLLCEELARGNDDLSDVYTLLGVIDLAEGNPAQAADSFRKALYLEPDQPEALAHMIVICDRRGDTVQANALRKRLVRVTRKGAP